MCCVLEHIFMCTECVCACGEKMTTFGVGPISFFEAGSFISLGLTYLVILNWLESTYLHQPKSEISYPLLIYSFLVCVQEIELRYSYLQGRDSTDFINQVTPAPVFNTIYIFVLIFFSVSEVLIDC